MTARYRTDAQALVPDAMRSPWTPTHRQLVELVIETAHRHGWLVSAMHDSRREHWAADSGWPDVFALRSWTDFDGRGYMGRGRAIAVEVKVPPDDLTDEQRAWWRALAAVPGIDAVVFRSVGDRVADTAALERLLA